MTPDYTAFVGNEPIAGAVTRGCTTAKQAAQAARRYAEYGEVITVIGPRGGKTEWDAVGNGKFGTVWKKAGR